MLSRRQAITTLAAAAFGTTAIGLYAWRVEPHWLEFTHSMLRIRGLPKEIEGSTLVQISDLHIGPLVDDEYIIESFRRVKEIKPEFVVYTGDWITYRGPGQFDQLQRVIAHTRHTDASEPSAFSAITTMVSTGGCWTLLAGLRRLCAHQELPCSATRQLSLVEYSS